jgi:hypothetical protein
MNKLNYNHNHDIELECKFHIKALENLQNTVIENHKEMMVKFSDLQEQLYDPDNGIYSKLKQHNNQINSLQDSKTKIFNSAKWLMITILGGSITLILKLVFETT